MEKINHKRYRIYKLIITIVLVAMMSTFVGYGNFIGALIVFVVAIFLMTVLRKNVKGVISDERAENVGGKAARMVLTVSALLITAAGIVLVSLRDVNPQFLLIGNIFLFLECGMMLFYAILFRYYYNKKK